MSRPIYSGDRVAAVRLVMPLQPSTRILPRRHLVTPLGTTAGDSRFCRKRDDYTVLYAATEFSTAFIETVVRDRFTRSEAREVPLCAVTELAWALIGTKPGQELCVLDLRGDGCVRLGAPTDAVNAHNHSAGRALGSIIHAEHDTIDGLLFASRLTEGDVYAIFDRAIGHLDAIDTGLLADHAELPSVLSRYEIGLTVA